MNTRVNTARSLGSFKTGHHDREFNPGVVARATYVAHSHKINFFSKTNRAKFLRFRVLKVVYFKDALSAAQASVARGLDDSRLAKYTGYDCSPRDQLRRYS
ncbi:hypothetical protein EVAR_56023_1 [Eumeta japonica]|uniref:Uncharacterized protein n=1 Tax=Eumeta variegata TaxID=151549 RepID=A0A4C1YIE3_EUMVA|nr:hypothetical protein EVAR_56023_1 [Eumeta japonica]